MNSKKILICSNYAWTIYNFRMPVIRELKKQGYIVEVLTQFDGYEQKIIKEVDKVDNLIISRKGINPLTDLVTFINILFSLYRSRPDMLLLFTIKPVIYGSLAANFFRIPTIPTITGLGTVFIEENFLTKIVKSLYRLALSSVSLVFFQNTADKKLFIAERLVKINVCRLSPGSGVDLDMFAPYKQPLNGSITFLLIARMLWDKGVGDFVEAAKIIKLKYPNTRFQLLGPLGVENRTAIAAKDIEKWQEEGFIEYLGETEDVISYMKEASCIVLPSYREGISRVLLEAAAVSRPLIASDVPGCREIIDDCVNGFLCEPRDSDDLSNKIERMLLLSHENRQIMGAKGRQKVEQEFDQDIVCKLYVDAINKVVRYPD